MLNNNGNSTPPRNQSGSITSAVNQLFAFAPVEQDNDEAIQREERRNRLENLSQTNSGTDFRNRTWENLLETNFFIGEIHRNLSPKKFLIQNMDLLKSSGYSVIFMEHLEEDLQQDLDTYRAADGRDTPEQLKFSLDRTTQGYMDNSVDCIEAFVGDAEPYKSQSQLFNYNAVVRAATKVGIKVVPLEISTENYTSFPRGKDRMIYLNSNTVDVVTREIAANPSLKYIGLVGSSHLLRKHDVPGICDALAVQDVVISDVALSGTAWANLNRVVLPRLIYDGGTVAKESVYLQNSAMGLTMDVAEDLSYEQNILPFYRATKDLESGVTSSEDGASNTTPNSAIRTLKSPVNPFKKAKISSTDKSQTV